MKFSGQILGLALAGALALSSVPASAQIQTEPYYLGLKLLYSDQKIDVGSSTYTRSGADHVDADPTATPNPIPEFNAIPSFRGTMPGGSNKKDTMGGAIAVGYDFYPFYQTPVRLELEFAGRGKNTQQFTTASRSVTYGGGQNPVGSLIQRGTNAQRLENTVYTLFINALWDFRNDTAFTPYIGAGVGGAYIKSRLFQSYSYYEYDTRYDNAGDYTIFNNPGQVISGKSNEWNLAWNLTAGVSYTISDNVLLDLSYRYADFGDTAVTVDRHFWAHNSGQTRFVDGGTSSIDLRANELMLGLRFTGY